MPPVRNGYAPLDTPAIFALSCLHGSSSNRRSQATLRPTSSNRLEVFAARDVGLVLDVVIEVDIFRQILFARMHVLPAGKHDRAAHASATRSHSARYLSMS
jgi:hypothetical protein